MKVRGIIAAILLTLGFVVLFSAAAVMDSGADWIVGAIRGVIGLSLLVAGGICANGVELELDNEDKTVDISDWRDAS